ncbi:hypothetical protein B0A55_11972 [Friedmanniomyces simplex]|uniref:Uncharacterized protein n=1 Tax=Friedmanniomyces simplex TaxID=329884 RepID=A0A4U0VW53_9PEZI|nr:hypothetical protein B0A55_11972 [Friedmanniomyces simplex]
MSTWASWLWPWGASGPNGPARPADAAHDPALRAHFLSLLDNTEPPQVFKPSEVAQLLRPNELAKLGYDTWKEAIPAIRELAFELRAVGYCEVLQKGKVLGDDVDLIEVEGAIRIRRMDNFVSKLTDDW